MTKRSEQVGDLLYGAKAIADHLGIDEAAARHRIAQQQIPTFKMEGMICSTKSGLAQFFEQRMAAALEPKP